MCTYIGENPHRQKKKKNMLGSIHMHTMIHLLTTVSGFEHMPCFNRNTFHNTDNRQSLRWLKGHQPCQRRPVYRLEVEQLLHWCSQVTSAKDPSTMQCLLWKPLPGAELVNTDSIVLPQLRKYNLPQKLLTKFYSNRHRLHYPESVCTILL